ncbi:MAG: hypothetical protein EDQ89_12255 [Acidobacteria bacterium]|nr:MAG: hypothetical protein EDQ89_12255 [Acidobacteriota bacterium]
MRPVASALAGSATRAASATSRRVDRRRPRRGPASVPIALMLPVVPLCIRLAFDSAPAASGVAAADAKTSRERKQPTTPRSAGRRPG